MITRREQAALSEAEQRLLELYHKGHYAPLLNEVDELVKEKAVTPGVLGLAAMGLVALERLEEALKAALEAVDRAPGQAWLHAVLAEVQSRLGHPDRAVEAQLRAAQLMPGAPEHTALLARYQRLNGQAPLAVRTARQALLTDDAGALALNELGLALQATGDSEGALAQFRAAQEAAPAEAEAYVNEGVLHLRAGARREARHALREALRRHPGLEEAENLLTRSLTGETGLVTATMLHLLNLGRFTVVGWLIIAFLYYLLFRLLEFVWQAWPIFLPAGQALLVVTLVYLLGGFVAGNLLRYLLRRG